VTGHEGEVLQHAQHKLHPTGNRPGDKPVLRLEAAVEGDDEVGRVLPGPLLQAEQAAHRHEPLAELLLRRAPHQGGVRVEVELKNRA
jgi:hypothetical protein